MIEDSGDKIDSSSFSSKWKLNLSQVSLHQTEITNTILQLFTASATILKTVVKKVLVGTAENNNNNNVLLVKNIERLLQLTMFAASIGPQLLENNLLKNHVAVSAAQNHQQNQQQPNSSSFSNTIGVMMNIENQHVVLCSEIDSILKNLLSSSSKNVVDDEQFAP